MKKQNLLFSALALAFTLLMSLPWLVPHLGVCALMGLLPLLVLERLAGDRKHLFPWHYGCFVLWNAVTTLWVGGATVGGAVFAILANALQMSLVFGSFRWVKRRLGGVLPYLYLAAAWIAWERFYLTAAQISWPWLVLGNAFAQSTSLIQWYSVTGTLGGSLWVWAANLSLFGLMVALSDGRMAAWRPQARAAAFAGTALAFFGPMLWSGLVRFNEEGPALPVVIGQPNLDPYEKFESLTQPEQDARLLDLLENAAYPADSTAPVLVLAPETFTYGLDVDQVEGHPSVARYRDFLQARPGAALLFGASTFNRTVSYAAPDPCSYDLGAVDGSRHLWHTAHNSALVLEGGAPATVYHKSKLVVGVEMTPYPRVFIPLERLLFGGPVMGKDVGQQQAACLPAAGASVGTAICYESVYGEHCAAYVREGANLLAVITNDAWWGNTPGYRQHFSYSRLRAIETRRWVARCGNTGISAVIGPTGRVLERTPWWQESVLQGSVQLLQGQSFFVRYGDITGRVCVLLFLLLGAASLLPRRGRVI